VERPRAEQAAVVGEGQRRHLELLRLADEVGDAVRAVEERKLGMRVEVDEAHESHRGRRKVKFGVGEADAEDGQI
jgi:hypothetical protein